MPVIKFDVSDVDPDESTAAPEPPPPGLYKAKIVGAVAGYKTGEDGKPDKSAPRIEVTYEVIESADEKNKNIKGGRVWDYVTFYDTTKRRLDQFLQAIGVATKGKRSGSFDPEKTAVGKIVKIRVYGERGREDYRPQIGGVWKWEGSTGEGASDDGLGDDETPAAPAKKAAAPAKKAAKKATAATKKAAAPPPPPNWVELGVAADGDDADAAQKLTDAATEAGLDPDDYPTWEELGVVLADGDGQGSGEEESGEEEPEGPSLAELGEAADGDDTDAQATLTELAEANDIDPNAYETWAEVADLLEAAGVDPNASGEDPF